MTLYSVWCERALGGDVFMGYYSKFISIHLDRAVAHRIAHIKSGWVEEEEDNLHPSYIDMLKKQDSNLRAAYQLISAADIIPISELTFDD